MDAARLVAEAERVMRGAPQPEDVIAEAWQAGELVEAVERLLAAGQQPPGADADTVGPAWAAGPAGRAGPVLAAAGAGPPRAARMTAVRDPAGTLRALRVLLGEITHALVGLTCAVQDEGAYWQCIEALDAVDEARDRVRALARGLWAPGPTGAGGLPCAD
ncbi:DUF6099 family protein [Actinacidiphila paucisporea]|uniref:Uncharacterized protein n=1 Tax=Actinacidiphila paucisporea TaxID=310782 RepID=A0A1M7LLK8_9ACTN|nr:DUF6099 family protein [Actinacidiphila paucisporea]SHM79109.1 hypothetical protein SAMN05216499_11497 [Actinacidiphila paucisporea]